MIRGDDGRVKLPGFWKMKDGCSSLISEAKATLPGIQMAVKFGYRKVDIESDCLTLINTISVQERGGSNFHLILNDIIHASSYLESVSWSFTRRNNYKVTHELAYYLPWSIGRKIWIDDFPSCIGPLIRGGPLNET